MRVSELSGVLLDYWVAKAEGHPLSSEWDCSNDGIFIGRGDGDLRVFAPSTVWSDAGPIIERERIGMMPVGIEWKSWAFLDMDATSYGDAALIAAMRAYVITKFGHYVPEVQSRP